MDNLSFYTNEAAAFKFYQTNGYFIEDKLLSDEICDELIAESQTFPSAVEGHFKPQMMPHRFNNKALEVMGNQKILHIMSKLVGGEACGLQTEFFYSKPGTRGFSNHQDNFFVEAKKEVFASAWIALTDTRPDNGGLIAYPGTHNEAILPTRKLFLDADSGQDPNANNEEVIIPDQYKPINAVVSKGSVFFLHGHLVHGSNPNLSNAYRHVLLCTYIKKGESFRPGRYAKREAVDFSMGLKTA